MDRSPKQKRFKRRMENIALSKQALKVVGRRTGDAGLPSLKRLRLKLKHLISLGVQIRDKRANKGLCLTCNAEPIYAAGHIIPDSDSLNTRYDPDNLYGTCRKCNFNEMIHRSMWSRPGGRFWHIFGPDKLIELNAKAAIQVKWSRADFQQKIEEAERWLSTIQIEDK